MTVLPSVRGKDLLAALKKAGFEVVRVKGSHHFLRDCELSREGLQKLL